MNIPVFVISLKTSLERRRRLEEHFKNIGLPFEWYDAVNGRALNQPDLEKYCDMESVNKLSHWLTRSAIGCALSHYNIYLEVIRRQAPYALIFEDDVVLKKDFQHCIEKMLPKLRKNEVVSLFYQSWYPLKLKPSGSEEFLKPYTLYEPADMIQPISAAAYVITLEACKTLTKAIIPIKVTADAWGEYKKIGGIENFRCVYPRPIDIIDAKSTIQYLEENWKGKLMKWVDRNKVFPLYQVLRMKRKNDRQKMMKVEIQN